MCEFLSCNSFWQLTNIFTADTWKMNTLWRRFDDFFKLSAQKHLNTHTHTHRETLKTEMYLNMLRTSFCKRETRFFFIPLIELLSGASIGVEHLFSLVNYYLCSFQVLIFHHLWEEKSWIVFLDYINEEGQGEETEQFV